jgi:hypothetical protein
VATDNTSGLSYINKQDGTWSYSLLSSVQSVGQTIGGHVRNSLQRTAPTVCVPGPQPSTAGSGCPVSLVIDRGMYMFPPFSTLSLVLLELQSTQSAEVILIAPWWPSKMWFPHLLHLRVAHLWALAQTYRPSVSAGGLISQRRLIPSAHVAVVVRHLIAKCFSQEVPEIAATPKQASTAKMYDARWR